MIRKIPDRVEKLNRIKIKTGAGFYGFGFLSAFYFILCVYYLLCISSGYISWRLSLSQATCSHFVPGIP